MLLANPSGEQGPNPFDTDSYNNSWNKNGPFERYKPLAEPFEQVFKYRFVPKKAAHMSKSFWISCTLIPLANHTRQMIPYYQHLDRRVPPEAFSALSAVFGSFRRS